VAELRRKPGGEELAVTIGDVATARVGSGYRLAYLVDNTVTNLLTQDGQVECLRTVADQLAPGGCFVVEVFVPQLRRMPPGQVAVPFHVGSRHVGFDRRRRVAAVGLAPLRPGGTAGPRRSGDGDVCRLDAPLRVAVGARPPGAHRGPHPDPPLGGLGPHGLHGGVGVARLGVDQGGA
jgi:hypothetical protein